MKCLAEKYKKECEDCKAKHEAEISRMKKTFVETADQNGKVLLRVGEENARLRKEVKEWALDFLPEDSGKYCELKAILNRGEMILCG